MKFFRIVSKKAIQKPEIKQFVLEHGGEWLNEVGNVGGGMIELPRIIFNIDGETSWENSGLLDHSIIALNQYLDGAVNSYIFVETPRDPDINEDFYRIVNDMVSEWDGYVLEDYVSGMDKLVAHLPAKRSIPLHDWA